MKEQAGTSEQYEFTNHLITEDSLTCFSMPITLLIGTHGAKSAFSQAKAENKPVLLSIGYSACHWCHVMAHESFEDEMIAQLMNENFVNIKVDREERPRS